MYIVVLLGSLSCVLDRAEGGREGARERRDGESECVWGGGEREGGIFL